jgi:chemotaxis protein methyltransferase CheR
VGETYFFRDTRSFEILEQTILRELLHARRQTEKRLRIWSVACCTGEEPYSIAMLLDKIVPDLKDWNITILATDINMKFLKKASEGIYNEWSFRDTKPWVKEKYFQKKKDGRFSLMPHIKKMVTFSYLNLAKDPFPSLLNNTNAMDIIFCRNILMYLVPETTKTVVNNLYLSLIDGGWLHVHPSETSQVRFSKFATINFPDAIFYRKDLTQKFTQLTTPQSLQSPLYKEHENSQVPMPAELIYKDPQKLTISKQAEPTLPQQKTNKADQSEHSEFDEAIALYEKGLFAEAADQLKKHTSNMPEDHLAMVLLARSYANTGRLTEALEWSEKALATYRLNPAYYYLHANILQEHEKMNEAVASLKQALYVDQNFVLAWFTLGNLLRLQGKAKESARHYENALNILNKKSKDETLPESEGLTAGRLIEIIQSITGKALTETSRLSPETRPEAGRATRAWTGV